MQVKKFEAPSLQEALDQVKRELGPDAIILQTRKQRKGLVGPGGYEVTAAVAEKAVQKKKIAERGLSDNLLKQVREQPAAKQAEFQERELSRYLDRTASVTRDQVSLKGRPSTNARPLNTGVQSQLSTRYIDIEDDKKGYVAPVAAQLNSQPARPVVQNFEQQIVQGNSVRDEIAALKSEIEALRAQRTEVYSAPQSSSSAASSVVEQLVHLGVDRKEANALVKQAEFNLSANEAESIDVLLDEVARVIYEGLEVFTLSSALNSERQVISLVGPTGVGKTTSLAKMAADFIKKGKRVALINLDQFKVGAFDQLATYAKALRIPFRSVSDREDLEVALADFSEIDVVLLDTTGRAQRESQALLDSETLMRGIPHLTQLLVVSATTREQELADIIKRYSLFNPDGLILTKTDEALFFGSIWNVHKKLTQTETLRPIRFAYLTHGQRVPEDLEIATKERIVSLILDI